LLRVVHVINQFFAGRGGEEAADAPPFELEGSVGPGKLIDRLLADRGKVVATVACGDTYFGDHPDMASDAVLQLVLRHQPDGVVCGPAFLAGRYGVACLTVAEALESQGIPCITGMHSDNPAIGTVPHTRVYVVATGPNAVGMAPAMESIVGLLTKRIAGEPIGSPAEEGYLPRGVRINAMRDQTAAARAIGQLRRKLAGESFETEIPLPVYDRVPPTSMSRPLKNARIALVTEAGVVPAGNPDRLESARATHWFKYPLAGVDDLRAGEYVTVHGGFDNTFVNGDPDRVLPVDAVRDLVEEGVVEELYDHYYVTTGMAMALHEAERVGREIAADLVNEGVHAVLVTST
jgi:betaine reductase